MASQAHALYHLQQLDLETLDHRKRLDQIAAQLRDNDAVKTAQAAVAEVEARLKPLRIKSRDLELEMQTNAQKAKSSEDRLYSGTVKNPKEMRDIQNEIDSLKKRNAHLEDQALELLINIEVEESELATLNAALKAIVAEWESQHSDLLDEQRQHQARLEALPAERESALKNINAENRKLYDSMRPKKANRPVAVMQGNTCAICGVAQTMAIELAVKRGEVLVYCENCGRILVHE